MKEWLVQHITVGAPDNIVKARRIEVFYGFHKLPAAERSARLTYLVNGKMFLYPNPKVCCLLLVLLMLKERKKRFFHVAILKSVEYFLFANSGSLGYKPNSKGEKMLQLVPEGVIAWLCVIVCHNFQNITLIC